MKIALVTEGTYPITTGGVSTWCDHLIRGLPEHQFRVVALGPYGTEHVVWPWPANVDGATIHGVWREPPSRRERQAALRSLGGLDQTLALVWDAALADNAVGRMGTALRDLVAISERGSVAAALAGRGSEHALAAVWRARAATRKWPALSVADAVRAAAIVDRVLALVDIRMAPVDLAHVTANGPCGLVGLATKWRYGTPFMVSEHGVYLRELYLSLRASGLSWGVRRAVTAFTRALSQVVFAEAELIAPVNHFNGRWERELGAPDARIRPIANGVDPQLYAPVIEEPDVPTVSFVGRIDPLKDLATLIRAHAAIRVEVPQARLRLFGPVPKGNEGYREALGALVSELGLDDAVSWEGAVPNSRPAIAAGNIVALSSISEGLPYSVLEAMMSGRPTVSTDVGGVYECFDGDRGAGVVVPPRSPREFADACIGLLLNPERRLDMGVRAAVLARQRFTLGAFLDTYRATYHRVVETARRRRSATHADEAYQRMVAVGANAEAVERLSVAAGEDSAATWLELLEVS